MHLKTIPDKNGGASQLIVQLSQKLIREVLVYRKVSMKSEKKTMAALMRGYA